MTYKGRSDTVRDDSWYIRDWRARWGCKDSSGKEQETSLAQGQYLFLLKKTCLCSYTLPVPALWVVWFRLAAPVPLPPRNPPRKLRPRRNRPDTPNVSVLSFLSSAHVVRLELNKTPFRLEWPRSLLKILLIFLFFLLAVWDLRVACYTMLHVQLFTQF